jgi:hypothetical protein
VDGPTPSPGSPPPERPSQLRRGLTDEDPTVPLPALERAASLRAMFPAIANPSAPLDLDTRSVEPESSREPASDPLPVAPALSPTARGKGRYRLVPAILGVFVVGVLVGVGTLYLLDHRSEADRSAAPAADPLGSAAVQPSASAATAAASASTSSAAAAAVPTPTPVSAAASPSPTVRRLVGRANPRRADLALNRPSATSSVERGYLASSFAFDGDLTTRWGSGFSDPQWISVDLGTIWQVSEIRLRWENAYATQYHVDVSPDGKRWSTVYATSAGVGGVVTIGGLSVPSRYVRLDGTRRSGQYGYSLLEFEVR